MTGKKELRSELKSRLRDLEVAKGRDESFLKGLMKMGDYRQAEVVFCYVSTENEPDTYPILEDVLKRGKKLCVPKCYTCGKMKACAVKDLSGFEKSAYGIPEPVDDSMEVKTSEIDFAVIPCLSANEDGDRLGHGAGYYDRFIENTRMTKAVLCREKMREPEIPMEIHDVRMDYLVTESEVIKCPDRED